MIYDDIVNSLNKNMCIPIGIFLDNNYKNIINYCDGIIFQGGDDIEEYDLDVLKYLYEIDKPTLCICLGMQEMGILFNGYLKDIDNHKSKSYLVHDIIIKKNSKLFEIFQTNKIKVNSRHKSVLSKTDLFISSVSDDGYIESIESNIKKFFVGVQWHPESINDIYSKKLFNYFLEKC